MDSETAHPICGRHPHCDWLALNCLKKQFEDDTIQWLKSKKALQTYAIELCELYMRNPEAFFECREMWVDKDGHLVVE